MDFQGFQNPYPLFVVIISIFLFVGVSWWSYRSEMNIPLSRRICLAALRSASLIILLLLVLNPFFYSSEVVEVDPGIAVFLDNSESIDIQKGTYKGLDSYQELLNRLNFNSINEIQFQFYSIGENTFEFDPDSLNAAEQQTNLSDAVNTVLEFKENIKAAIFITDGIITYGKNPVFSASSSTIPLHTIAIGDTTGVKDISVSNILTNAIGYTHTSQNVKVEIKQSGFLNRNVTIYLQSGNEILQQKQISFEADEQVKTLNFELSLDVAGLQQFEIKAEELDGEWTGENNNSYFSIDVLDNKVKILHIAFEIHPDVKTIRSVINSDINNELITLTYLGDNRFIEDLPKKNDFNLVIIHGAPNTGQIPAFLNEIDQVPTIYFTLPSSHTSSNTNAGSKPYELITALSNEFIKAVLNPLMRSNEHSVLDLPVMNHSTAPPLSTPLRSKLEQAGTTAVFGLTYNDIALDNPMIAVYEQGNIRRSHVVPWGWYKLMLSKDQEHRDYLEHLIGNLVSWTSSNPDEQMLQIQPVRQSFSTFENPSLAATLKNESGVREDDAIIEVEVNSKDGNTSTFNMQNTGNGNYNLELPRYGEGLYAFKASARKGSRIIEEKSGEFLVANSSSELTDTHRNDALLRAISNNSGGLFFTYDNVKGFWDSLSATGLLESHEQIIEKYDFPVRSVLWFVLVLVLLTSEWMLRKYYSLT